MSNNKNIIIEKRIFKLSGNETFLLEYPSNYQEIANKKINNLEKDYESVINNNITIPNENNKNIQKQSIDKKEIQNNNILLNNDDNKPIETENLSNNNYYQPINSSNNFGNEDENPDKDNKKNSIQLEPQEGFIEIKKMQKNCNIKENKKDEDEISEEEFYEVIEKENEINIKENNKNSNLEKVKNKNNLSPIKNAENIKIKMKSLNFKAPKWAENLNDEDFINMAKNIISSKKNK